MAVVNIYISNRIASVEAGVELVCNNPTDTIRFIFDDEWKEHLAKTVRFSWEGQYIDKPFTGDQVETPEIFRTNHVFVGVYADNIASTPVKVPCRYSIKCMGGNQAAPSPDVYAQLLEAINAKSIVGVDGVSITDVGIDDNAHLIVTLSNGDTIDAGYCKGTQGEDGSDGVDIANANIDENGHLIVTMSNGEAFDAGLVKGEQGEDGSDGVGVANAAIDANGHLLVTLSNGETLDAGNAKGEKGNDGSVSFNDLTDEQKAELVGEFSDQVAENTQNITQYNVHELLETYPDTVSTVTNGITWSCEDGVFSVVGTASSTWFANLYKNSGEVPSWFVPGAKINVRLNAIGSGVENLCIQVYKYAPGGTLTWLAAFYDSQVYTVPETFDGVGLIIRLRIEPNTTVNLTAKPEVLNAQTNEELTASQNRLFPHRAIVFGDSIILGRDGNGSSTTIVGNTIPRILSKMLRIECANNGVSGMGWLPTPTQSLTAYNAISSVDLAQYDTIILSYGVNDTFNTLGTWDGQDEATVMGQFHKCINYIYQQNQTARVIVLSPINGRNNGTFPKYWYAESSSTSYNTRIATSNALQKACEWYNIPYIRQDNSPINGFTIDSLIGADGSHPSAEGYKRLGEWLAGEIARIIGY